MPLPGQLTTVSLGAHVDIPWLYNNKSDIYKLNVSKDSYKLDELTPGLDLYQQTLLYTSNPPGTCAANGFDLVIFDNGSRIYLIGTSGTGPGIYFEQYGGAITQLLPWDGLEWKPVVNLPYPIGNNHDVVVAVNNTAETLPYLQAIEFTNSAPIFESIDCKWLYDNAPPWYTGGGNGSIVNIGFLTTFLYDTIAPLIPTNGVGIGSALGSSTQYAPSYQGLYVVIIYKSSADVLQVIAIGINGSVFGCSYSSTVAAWNTITGAGSNTITHRTNIINYDSSMIGCACDTTGEISDVYGDKFIPSLERATDAITKVKISNNLSASFWGVIVSDDTFANVGDVIVRVVDGIYSPGDVLAPGAGGYFHKATDPEKYFINMQGCPRVKVAAKIADNAEIVCAFIQ
jgi:hypothetical protein